MNVSFSGCGFLGLYHVGVASCIKTYAPQLYLNKVAGASAGSMAALALLADLPIGEMTSQVLKLAMEARKCTFGPFSPSFNINTILSEGLQSVLPEDVHLKVSCRCLVGLKNPKLTFVVAEREASCVPDEGLRRKKSACQSILQ